MVSVHAVTDLSECQATWRRAIREETMTDLWAVRACFQRHFRRPPHFLVAEDAGEMCGFLPLSRIEEADGFGYFPGETWEGKTWLEQNRIVARDPGVLEALLGACPGDYHLRYLLPVGALPADDHLVDERGYLFLPPRYDYDLDNYFQREFSGKAARKLRRELAAIQDLGLTYRYDNLGDFEHMVSLNVDRFGERSYFFDARFRESFRDLMHLLHAHGWLRMTTIVINGDVAAVDMGCLYRGAYTLVAGGTHPDYRGVAKVINIHHMRRACTERMQQVDFLCGEFSWKPLFRLIPRPLYVLTNVSHETPPTAACREETARVE